MVSQCDLLEDNLLRVIDIVMGNIGRNILGNKFHFLQVVVSQIPRGTLVAQDTDLYSISFHVLGSSSHRFLPSIVQPQDYDL